MATEQWNQYNPVPASNNMPVPVGAPAGIYPASVEPIFREFMASFCNLGLNTGGMIFADGGIANALEITTGVSGGVTLAKGNLFRVAIANTTTVTAPTLTVDSNTAVPITYSGGSAVIAGSLVAGTICDLLYNGTTFELHGSGTVPISQGGTGGTSQSSALYNLTGFTSIAAAAAAAETRGSGYYRSADGTLFQMQTTGAISANSGAYVYFPTSFPNSVFGLTGNLISAGGISNGALTIYPESANYCFVVNQSSSPAPAFLFSMGY